MNLHGRNLLSETDLSREEFLYLVELGRQLREEKRQGRAGRRLAGRNIALIFEKTSTRTRSAFEVAAHDEGGHVTVTGDVHVAVAGADFVYTDVWLSLGEPEDLWDARIDQLLPYQVNAGVRQHRDWDTAAIPQRCRARAVELGVAAGAER